MRGLLATAALLLATALPASAAVRPRLAVVSASPQVVVRGTGFRPRERVTVRLYGRTVTAKVVSASAAGVFRAALAKPRPLACGQLILRASGSRGSVVLVRMGPPECNPPGMSRG